MNLRFKLVSRIWIHILNVFTKYNCYVYNSHDDVVNKLEKGYPWKDI